jgi:hypothetical protein
MSAPAPTSSDQIAAAIARAERRLRLLGMMTRFCMALLRALTPGGAAGALFGLAWAKAYAAISRGIRLSIRIEAETRRLLRDLRAGILPAPRAERPRPAERAETEELEDLEDLEDPRKRVETESDTAFRARLEALEALLDQEAHADWSVQGTVRVLCRALNLKPDWSGWLGDDWIEDNLDAPFRQLLADTRAAPPPTPTLSPPAGGSTGKAGEGDLRRAPAFAPPASVSRPALFHSPPPPRSLSSGSPPARPGGGPPPPAGEERIGAPSPLPHALE